MDVTTYRVIPKKRCAESRSQDVESTCHHCGTPLSASHSITELKDKRRHKAYEYKELFLSQLDGGKIPAHCQSCLHYVEDPYWFLPPQALSVFGMITGIALVVLSSFKIIPLWGIIIGIVVSLASMFSFLFKRKSPKIIRKQIEEQRSSFPVLGQTKVSISEKIQGSLKLTKSGTYILEPAALFGHFKYSLFMTDHHREQMQKYLQHFDLSAENSVECNGGVLFLNSDSVIQPINYETPLPGHGLQKIKIQTPLHNLIYLIDHTSREDSWDVEFKYSMNNISDAQMTTSKLPLYIIPKMINDGNQPTLALEIHINRNSPEHDTTKIKHIESLSIDLPANFGDIRYAKPNASILQPTSDNNIEKDALSIVWKNIKLNSEQTQKGYTTVYLGLMDEIPEATSIQGKLLALYDGSISGVKDFTYYNALGSETAPNSFDKTTEVGLQFELDLESLKNIENVIFNDTFNYLHVIPNSHVTTDIVKKISDAGFYIKNMIETPTTPSVKRQHCIKLNWDIEGRYYLGILPIDFQIMLAGESPYSAQPDGFTGSTIVNISISAEVNSESLKQQVKDSLNDLRKLLETTLLEHQDIDRVMNINDQIDTGVTASAEQISNIDESLLNQERMQSIAQALTQMVQKNIQSNSAPLSKETQIQELTHGLSSGFISESLYKTLRQELDKTDTEDSLSTSLSNYQSTEKDKPSTNN